MFNPFFDQWGRFSYYLLSSGLINELEGQVQKNFINLRPNKRLVILRSNHIDDEIFNGGFDLSIVLFDGIEEYKNNQNLFERLSKNNLSFHYVGEFKDFWKKVPNSFPLYPFESINSFLEAQKKYKKLYSQLYYQRNRQLGVTGQNFFKNSSLFVKILFGSPKYIYFGNITPSESIIKYYKHHGINEKYFSEFCNKKIDMKNINKAVNLFCKIKNIYLEKFIEHKPHVLISYINLLLRNLVINLIKTKKNVIIHDGKFKGFNFYNAYQSFGGNQHTYLDFGSKLGFDTIYPRVDDIFKYKKKYLFLNLKEEFIFMNESESFNYLNDKILDFITRLDLSR